MNRYPQALRDLIDAFKMLPSVGEKTAERYAFYVLNSLDETQIIDFVNALDSIHKDIHICKSCGNMSEGDYCYICQNEQRNHKQLLVVEGIKDLYTIEALDEYKGVYHVLGGAISLSKGITINDLNIEPLIVKAKNNEINEVILATNATLEGETTARYIKELLKDYDIKITRIAHGLPVGGDISYADEMTILRAFEGRREY